MASTRVLVSVLLAALAWSCATSSDPGGAAALPALAPGQGRIVLYMSPLTEAPQFRPILTLDGADLGKMRVGTYSYVDRPPGAHELGVRAESRLAAFGEQGATEPLAIALADGDTAYVRISTQVLVGMVRPTLTRVDPASGERDVAKLSFAAPSAPAD
jgi:hypothetical protein